MELIRFDSPVHVLPYQLERLSRSIVPPEHFVGVDLGEEEAVVVRTKDLALFHGSHRRRAAAVRVFAQFLRSGIDRSLASRNNQATSRVASSRPRSTRGSSCEKD